MTVNAVYANRLSEIDERAERERELREDIDVYRMASEAVIDEIVPPSELRAEIASGSRCTRLSRRTDPTRTTGPSCRP